MERHIQIPDSWLGIGKQVPTTLFERAMPDVAHIGMRQTRRTNPHWERQRASGKRPKPKKR